MFKCTFVTVIKTKIDGIFCRIKYLKGREKKKKKIEMNVITKMATTFLISIVF